MVVLRSGVLLLKINVLSFQPKMENIPEGDWYCFECVSKVSYFHIQSHGWLVYIV